MTKQESIRHMHFRNPALTSSQLADAAGCTRRTVRYALEKVRKNVKHSPAKILLFDLETSPMEVYSWGLWKQVIQPHQVMKDWSILSWSAKWLFESEVMGLSVTPEEAHKRDDSTIVPQLWSLMDESDIIIAHNANKFDVKRMNTRFILNGMLPPSPYRVIDTLASIKRTFGFSSNKLDYVNQLLSITKKMEHEGFSMWDKAVNGKHVDAVKSLDNMLAYNKVDVVALEDLYMVIRPWIKSHPNLNLYQDGVTDLKGKMCCGHCYSTELTWEDSKYYTFAGRFKSFRCNHCGAVGRNRISDLTKQERKNLGLVIAN